MTETSLVVKLTCGADDPERANQALNVAAIATSSGVGVSLWLAGEAAWLAAPQVAPEGRGTFALEHASDPGDLLAGVLAGGRVTVCSQCAQRRELVQAHLTAGAVIAGSATFTEEVLQPGVQALVY